MGGDQEDPILGPGVTDTDTTVWIISIQFLSLQKSDRDGILQVHEWAYKIAPLEDESQLAKPILQTSSWLVIGLEVSTWPRASQWDTGRLRRRLWGKYFMTYAKSSSVKAPLSTYLLSSAWLLVGHLFSYCNIPKIMNNVLVIFFLPFLVQVKYLNIELSSRWSNTYLLKIFFLQQWFWVILFRRER
jgi:hypothetical protein